MRISQIVAIVFFLFFYSNKYSVRRNNSPEVTHSIISYSAEFLSSTQYSNFLMSKTKQFLGPHVVVSQTILNHKQ